MGSFIALDFAVRYPEKVDRLLMGAGAVAKCDAMSIHMFCMWRYVASAYGVVSEELARELLTKAFSRTFLDEMGEELVSETMGVLARNTERSVFINACQAMIDTDVRGILADVKAPAVVVVGAEDILTPVDAGPGGAGRGRVTWPITSLTVGWRSSTRAVTPTTSRRPTARSNSSLTSSPSEGEAWQGRREQVRHPG